MAAHRHPAAALLLAWLLQAPALAAPPPPRATLTGRAINTAREELAGAVVTLLAADGAAAQGVATTNARGVYRFENLDPGVSWSIQVAVPTYATVVLGPFKLAEGQETRVDVEMKLASGSPNPGERVHSIGNPVASTAMWIYTSGTVRQVLSAKTSLGKKQKLDAKVIETQSPIKPGDSGGPTGFPVSASQTRTW